MSGPRTGTPQVVKARVHSVLLSSYNVEFTLLDYASKGEAQLIRGQVLCCIEGSGRDVGG